MTQAIPPELTERMVALVRSIHDCPPERIVCSVPGWRAHALEIAALLPEPPDPDLLEARKLAATRGDGGDARLLSGDWDHFEAVAYRLEGIKHGRDLERSGK